MLNKSGKILLITFIGLLAFSCFNNFLYYSKSLDFLTLEQSEFDSYLESFGKTYEKSEYFSRLETFTTNMAFIRVFNSQGFSWVLGPTEFTDLKVEEFKSKFEKVEKSGKSEKNSQASPKVKVFPEGNEKVRTWDYPQTVDWRTQGAVTPVANQGNCNSGWAFSAAGAIESAWQLSGKVLIPLSEQQLMDCSSRYGNNGCTGGTMDYAFNYVIDSGIASDADYPYKAVKGTCNAAVKATANITSFTDVLPNSPQDLYNAVAKQPVAVAVDADPYIWQNYKGGVVSRNCGADLNHAALVVGYNSISTPPYWVIKNSFGASWGESGYIRLAVVNGDGVCGVQKQASYPNI
jgi:C1A family cysteine protease